MAVRQTQQVRLIAYDTTPIARITSIKAEVLMREAAAPGGGGSGGTIVTVIMSG
jgi:hypothetical protein